MVRLIVKRCLEDNKKSSTDNWITFYQPHITVKMWCVAIDKI